MALSASVRKALIKKTADISELMSVALFVVAYLKNSIPIMLAGIALLVLCFFLTCFYSE